MNIYTKNLTDIYFLNDKNIVQNINDDTTINPIPSLSLLQSIYHDINISADEISSYIKNLELSAEGISNTTNILYSRLSTKLSDLEISVGGISGIVTSISNGLSTELSNLEVLVGGISGIVTSISTNLSTELSNLEVSVGGISGIVTSISTNLSTELSDLEVSVGGISRIVTSISNGISTELSDLEVSVGGISGIVTSISNGLSTELSAVELSIDGISSHTSKLELSTNNISNYIDKLTLSVNNISNATEEKFVHLTGDTIDHLDVANNLSIANNLIVDGKIQLGTKAGLTAINNVFIWNGHVDNTYSDHGHGTFSINPEKGVNDFYIGEQTLSNIIHDDVKKSYDNLSTQLSSISTDLSTTIDSYGYSIANSLSIDYDNTTRNIIVKIKDQHNTETSASLSFDKIAGSGIVNSVDILTAPSEKVDEPTIRIWWKSENGNPFTDIPVNNLAQVYTAGEGIAITDNLTISVTNDIARSSTLNELSAKTINLSTDFKDLSTTFDIVQKLQTKSLKFLGEINLTTDDIVLTTLLKTINLNEERLYNGTYINVNTGDKNYHSVKLPDGTSTIIEDKDRLIIHSHNSDVFVALSDLVLNDTLFIEHNLVTQYNVDSISTNLSTELSNLEVSVGGISGIVTSISNGLSTKLSDLEVSVGGISGIVTSISTNLSTELSNLEVSVGGISGIVTSISNGLSTKLSDLEVSVDGISTECHNKIYIKDQSSTDTEFATGNYTNSLSIIKISKEKYEEMLVNNLTTGADLSSNILYVVSSDYIDAYGQEIKNVAMSSSIEIGEAVNKPYADNISTELRGSITSIENKLGKLSAFEQSVYINDPVLSSLGQDMTIETAMSAIVYLFNKLAEIKA